MKTLILKILCTAVLIVGIMFFIRKDYLKFQEFLSSNPVSHSLRIEHDKVKNKAMMVTINHYRPDLTNWKSFIVEGKPLGKTFLNDSIYYYELLSSYIPQIAEPQHLLGLTYFLRGDLDKALEAQQKAVVLEPRYFWSWYNLGVMYYRQNDFEKSAQAFKNALTVSPQTTVKILGTSRIYGEVVRSAGTVQAVAVPHLQQGYRDAALLLEASIQHLRGQPVSVAQQQLQLKVF